MATVSIIYLTWLHITRPEQTKQVLVHPEQDLWEKELCDLPWRARKAAPKKRRRARRNRVRLVKQPAATPLRKRFPQQKRLLPRGSALGSTKDHHPAPPHASRSTPPATFTSPFSHSNNSTSRRTIFHKCGTVSWSVLKSLRLEANKTSFSNELIRPVPEQPKIRLVCRDSSRRSAESRTTHARDWTATEQPNASH